MTVAPCWDAVRGPEFGPVGVAQYFQGFHKWCSSKGMLLMENLTKMDGGLLPFFRKFHILLLLLDWLMGIFFHRKPSYFMVNTMVSGEKFPDKTNPLTRAGWF